jgi:hypothetical protein
VVLETGPDGRLSIRDQLADYMFRGEGLESYSVLEFFADTYDDQLQDASVHDAEPVAVRAGRPRSWRVPYLPDHPKSRNRVRVIRSAGHNTIPRFIGRYFPRRDDPDVHEFYCASMLTLLKPWRKLCDLKPQGVSWQAAFAMFTATAPPHVSYTLSNIHLYHRAELAAEEDRRQEKDVPDTMADDLDDDEMADLIDEDNGAVSEGLSTVGDEFTEVDLQLAFDKQFPKTELFHGRKAVEIARACGVFPEPSLECPDLVESAPRASDADVQQLSEWKAAMLRDSQLIGLGISTTDTQRISNEGQGGATVELIDLSKLDDGNADVQLIPDAAPVEASLPALDPSSLLDDQRRAYDIIRSHLGQHLSGEAPPQLLMQIQGEGGTGKSRVIQTITELFRAKGVSSMLVKGAYTGIAASLIDGKTTHRLAFMNSRGNKLDDPIPGETRKKLEHYWRHKAYLIIDEVSMISPEFLAVLSKRITVAWAGDDTAQDADFGRMNVVLCGDFHQFPPVASGNRASLYYPPSSGDSPSQRKGKEIFGRFQTVVVLSEQVRVSDPVWLAFLRRLRTGMVEQDDINMLRSLVISHPDATSTDFSSALWDNASLVTPRHGVRLPWNATMMRRESTRSSNQVYICPAHDTIHGRSLNIAERVAVAQKSSGDRGAKGDLRGGLPSTVEIARGMKIMVTENVDTDLDIANGSRGVVTAVVLDPDEPQPNANTPIVTLLKPPLYIVVKLDRTKAQRLPGLEANEIPIAPAKRKFRIVVRPKDPRSKADPITRTVTRLQYPVTAAYAFTDYRSQGQTIPCVLVDIGKPPNGKLTIFNIYVALSRSSGRETIRLLRNFEDAVLLQPLPSELVLADERLLQQNEATKEWWARIQAGSI